MFWLNLLKLLIDILYLFNNFTMTFTTFINKGKITYIILFKTKIISKYSLHSQKLL